MEINLTTSNDARYIRLKTFQIEQSITMYKSHINIKNIHLRYWKRLVCTLLLQKEIILNPLVNFHMLILNQCVI